MAKPISYTQFRSVRIPKDLDDWLTGEIARLSKRKIGVSRSSLINRAIAEYRERYLTLRTK